MRNIIKVLESICFAWTGEFNQSNHRGLIVHHLPAAPWTSSAAVDWRVEHVANQGWSNGF